MKALPSPNKSPQHKGALRGSVHVLKTVARDPSTRHSAKQVGRGSKTIGRVGKGIAEEIAQNDEVRKAAKRSGKLLLEGGGIARYDIETGKHVPNARGIKRALVSPELALKDALVAGRKDAPNLGNVIVKAAPDAIRKYHRENPGALREATSAAIEVAKGTITLPFYMGIAAVNGSREVRASNRALEEDAAKYRALPSNDVAPIQGFTVHTTNGPTHITFGGTQGPGEVTKPAPLPTRQTVA